MTDEFKIYPDTLMPNGQGGIQPEVSTEIPYHTHDGINSAKLPQLDDYLLIRNIPKYREDFVTRHSTNAIVTDQSCYGAVFDEATGSSGSMDTISVDGTYGCAIMNQPTSPAANENSWFGSGGSDVLQLSVNPILEVRIQCDPHANEQRVIVGFLYLSVNAANSADTNTATDEVMFRLSSTGTTWECVTRGGGGTEVVTVTNVTTTSFHTLRIEATSSLVRFLIDGVVVAAHNTGLPTASKRMGWYIGNGITSTNDRYILIDYILLY